MTLIFATIYFISLVSCLMAFVVYDITEKETLNAAELIGWTIASCVPFINTVLTIAVAYILARETNFNNPFYKKK